MNKELKKEIEGIKLFLAGKNRVVEDVIVYPNTGAIVREKDNYTVDFREYIINDRVYIDIDGQKYNKAKLIYDSVNKDNLPTKRYTVYNKDGNITNNRIMNLCVGNLHTKSEVVPVYDINVEILFEGIETTIGVELLLERLASKEYVVSRNDSHE